MIDDYYSKEILFEMMNFHRTDCLDFYRDVFPEGSFERRGRPEDGKANGILCSIKKAKGEHRLVFDDLREIREALNDEMVIISPVAYFGKRRTAYNASLMYGMTFDLDGVGEEELLWILERLDNPYFPRPSYIANSGDGVHLYYLFKKPIPLYRSVHERLNKLKHALTNYIWNKYTSRLGVANRQYQGIFQGFRVVGGHCKIGNGRRITVYRTGGKIDIDYLNQYVNEDVRVHALEYTSSLTLAQAKDKYPEWYKRRILEGRKSEHWAIKRDLYDWWLRKIETDDDVRVGHRYWCISVLAAYAKKCSFYHAQKNPHPVTEDELRRDAYSLLPRMRQLKEDFTIDDIESALNFYQESYITLPRKEIIRVSGLKIAANRRNYRTQKDHVRMMNFVRDEINQNKTWNKIGNGRKSKQNIVKVWRRKNPTGRKIDCHRQTGISRPTIDRWWDK